MESIVKLAKQAMLRKQETCEITDDDILLERIQEIKMKINSIEDCFNMESDDDMVDALIYELNAFIRKYNYLVAEAKRRNLVSNIISLY